MNQRLLVILIVAAISFAVGRASVDPADLAGTGVTESPTGNPQPGSASERQKRSLRASDPPESRHLPSSIRRRAGRGMTLDSLSSGDRKVLFQRAADACMANLNPLMQHESVAVQSVASSENGSVAVSLLPKPPAGVSEAILKKGLVVFQEFGEFSLPAMREILKALEKRVLVKDQDLYIVATSRGDGQLSLSGYYAKGEMKFELVTSKKGIQEARKRGARPTSTFSVQSNGALFDTRFSHLFGAPDRVP